MSNNYPKVFEELSLDPVTDEALKALKGLYPKSTSENRNEELRCYYHLRDHIYDMNTRLYFLRKDLEKFQKDRFSK